MREEPVVIGMVFLEKLVDCAGAFSGNTWEGYQPDIPGLEDNLNQV